MVRLVTLPALNKLPHGFFAAPPRGALACTPLVMLLSGQVVLGEFPRPGGLLGVLALVAGSLLLHLEPTLPRSLRAMVRSWRQPGVRSMLAAALFYGLAAVLAKQAAIHSSALFFATTFFLAHNSLLLLLVLWGSGRLAPARLLRHPRDGIVTGLLLLQVVCHNLALVQSIPSGRPRSLTP